LTTSTNQQKLSQKPYLKYFTFSIITIFILSLGANLFIKNKVKNRLAIIEGLSHQKIDANILFRKITINEIQYKWSSERQDSSNIYCQEIDIVGISWWNLLVDNNLTINNLTIENLNGIIKSPFTFSQKKETPSEQSQPLKDIFIENLFLKETTIDFTHLDDWNAKLEDLNLHIQQLHYPTAQPKKSLDYTDFNLSFANASWMLKDGLYSLHCAKFDSKMSSQNLLVTNLELRPQYSKATWKNYIPHKKARLHLKIPKVEMMKINYQKLLGGEGLWAEDLTLHQANLDVFSSKELPPCVDCYKSFIHEKLLKAKLPINLKKIQLKENKIHINTINEQVENMINISFDNIFASIYNVTNIKENIKANSKIIADIKSLVAGEAKLETQINFYLDSPLFAYQINAKVNQFDLTKINKIFDFGAKVKIESGQLNQLNFQISGDNQLASGEMKFAYENLKIEVINTKKGKVKKLLSRIANLGIKNDNNKPEGNFEKGKIYYPRVKNKGIFHQWYGAIQSGFKSTILPDIILKKELE